MYTYIYIYKYTYARVAEPQSAGVAGFQGASAKVPECGRVPECQR